MPRRKNVVATEVQYDGASEPKKRCPTSSLAGTSQLQEKVNVIPSVTTPVYKPPKPMYARRNAARLSKDSPNDKLVTGTLYEDLTAADWTPQPMTLPEQLVHNRLVAPMGSAKEKANLKAVPQETITDGDRAVEQFLMDMLGMPTSADDGENSPSTSTTAAPLTEAPPSPPGYNQGDGDNDVHPDPATTLDQLVASMILDNLNNWINPESVETKAMARYNLNAIAHDPNVDVEIPLIMKTLSLKDDVLLKAREVYAQKHMIVWHLFNVFRNRSLYEKKKAAIEESMKKEAPLSLEKLLATWIDRKEPIRAAVAGNLLDTLAGNTDDPREIGRRLQLPQKVIDYHVTKAKTSRNAVWRMIYEWKKNSRQQNNNL
jgi:hypothetical protein